MCGTTHIPVNAYYLDTPLAYSRQNIEIPIVFHIVYESDDQNLGDAILLSQLEVINEDFTRVHPRTKELPKKFNQKVASPGIRFCLASTDPLGNPSTGIIRVPTTVENVGNQSAKIRGDRIIKDSELGGSSPWDEELYLNVWIGQRDDDITGDATFPNDPDETEFEGIVLDYRVVGNNPDQEGPFNKGRTLTHEIGHYLNVFHLYGSETGCFTDDDFVEDTPTQFGPYFGSCEEAVFSCGSQDMDTNFMNFRDDDCLFYFTKGQVDRMLFTLFNERYELINSQTCSTVKPIPPDPLKFAPIINLPNGLEIPLNTLNEEDYTLFLFDMRGQLIWKQKATAEHKYVIRNSEIPTGIYNLVLALNNELFTRKVFIN